MICSVIYKKKNDSKPVGQAAQITKSILKKSSSCASYRPVYSEDSCANHNL